MKRILMPLVLGALLFAQEPPEVLSTAKDRVDLGITVYHGGLAMVRDTRRVKLPAGRSRLAFADVAASIRPKSAWVQFKGATPMVLERNYEFDLLSPQSLVDRSLGMTAGFRQEDGTLEWGELVSLPMRKPRWAPWRTPLQRLARIGPMIQRPDPDVLIRKDGTILAVSDGDLLIEQRPNGLRASPTMLMELESPGAFEATLELAYTAERFHWEANYVARLTPTGQAMALDGFVTLTNKSGQAFDDLRLQVVAGDPNQIHDPPPRNLDEPTVDGTTLFSAGSVPPGFREERLADYLLLSLDRSVTLGDGQTKQVKLFSAPSVAIEPRVFMEMAVNLGFFSEASSRSKSPGVWIREECPYQGNASIVTGNPEQTAVSDARPQLLLHLKNIESTGLGRPLPKGRLSLRLQDLSGSELPLEDLRLEAIPPGEDTFILISTLPAQGVTSALNWRPLRWRKGWMELEAEVEARNARNEPMGALLRIELPQESEIRSSDLPATQAQPGTFDFRLTLPPHSTRTFRFTARIPKSGLPFSY